MPTSLSRGELSTLSNFPGPPQFAGSKIGGERAAAIYTVIETCKMNRVEPQVYIADVIAKIAADWPASRWDELMPWNWKASEERARLAA